MKLKNSFNFLMKLSLEKIISLKFTVVPFFKTFVENSTKRSTLINIPLLTIIKWFQITLQTTKISKVTQFLNELRETFGTFTINNKNQVIHHKHKSSNNNNNLENESVTEKEINEKDQENTIEKANNKETSNNTTSNLKTIILSATGLNLLENPVNNIIGFSNEVFYFIIIFIISYIATLSLFTLKYKVSFWLVELINDILLHWF